MKSRTSQKSTVIVRLSPTMLLMALAAWFYSIAIALTRVRAIILERERHAGWAGEVALAAKAAR